MEIRHNKDEESGLPHIYAHSVSEEEVEEVLRQPLESDEHKQKTSDQAKAPF